MGLPQRGSVDRGRLDVARLVRIPHARIFAAVVLLALSAMPLLSPVRASAASPSGLKTSLAAMRVISYYPARNPWSAMWTNWDSNKLASDFALIHALNSNTVRIFVPTDTFGFPTPSGAMLSKLSQLVCIAANSGLQTYVNLFDLNLHYPDFSDDKTWANAVVGAALHPSCVAGKRVAAFEVMNEIDPSNTNAVAWAKTMIPYVRRIAGGVPASISICGCDNAYDVAPLYNGLGTSQPDFYSFHYYTCSTSGCTVPDVGLAQYVFNMAAAEVHGIPLIVGEAGFSTGATTTVGSTTVNYSDPTLESQQSAFFANIGQAARNDSMPAPGVWTLCDFSLTTGISLQQQYYGLYSLGGLKKPAAGAVWWNFQLAVPQ